KSEQHIKSAKILLKNSPGSKAYANKLADALKDRTTAKSLVTRYTNQLAKLKSSSTVPTVPAKYNPGGPLVMLQPPTHPGPFVGTLVASPPSTAYVADLHKEQRSAAVESDVRNYTMMAN